MEPLPTSAFLRPTDVVDFSHPSVLEKVAELSGLSSSPGEYPKIAFDWVRDSILHSHDHSRNPVTWKASDVLASQTGFCFAKSHLLAALLRAKGIPTGFCYQRISRPGEEPYLHGLCAIYLPQHGWYRADPRGNKPGVDAQFTPPIERLAYPPTEPWVDPDPVIYPDPQTIVIDLLKTSPTIQEVLDRLPRITG
jgi:transglutaminase-like putative cysteine protease